MSKEGIKSIIEDCSRRVPPRHSPYLDYFKTLTMSAEEDGADQNKIAARLWLALLRPEAVPAFKDLSWGFQMDEQLLYILQKLTSRGFIGAGDVIDVSLQSGEGEACDIQTFDIIGDTLAIISKDFNAHGASSSAELKLIQFLLTASTNPNRAISGDLLAVALNKLAEVFLYSKQTVNQNAARAAITQLVSERMDVPPSASKTFQDQGRVQNDCFNVIPRGDFPVALPCHL